MLKVNILRKFLDYSFIENKVYVPQVETVECVKNKVKAITHGVSACDFGILITQMF